jgi:hypothetical protein
VRSSASGLRGLPYVLPGGPPPDPRGAPPEPRGPPLDPRGPPLDSHEASPDLPDPRDLPPAPPREPPEPAEPPGLPLAALPREAVPGERRPAAEPLPDPPRALPATDVLHPIRHTCPSTAQNALRATTYTVTALSGKMSGGVLLSHAVPHAVPSALKGLTSGFGMGPGVSPSPWPPKHYGDVTRPPAPADICRTDTADRTSGTAQWTHAKSISRSQATRPISTGQLHTLPCFHLRPINPVV